MSISSEGWLAALVLSALLAFILGGWIGTSLAAAVYRREAIQSGAAHYDTKTGVFTWNNPPTSESEKP